MSHAFIIAGIVLNEVVSIIKLGKRVKNSSSYHLDGIKFPTRNNAELSFRIFKRILKKCLIDTQSVINEQHYSW